MDCVSESHVIVIFQDMGVDFKLCQTQRQAVSSTGPGSTPGSTTQRAPLRTPVPVFISGSTRPDGAGAPSTRLSFVTT